MEMASYVGVMPAKNLLADTKALQCLVHSGHLSKQVRTVG